jgi:predicted metalloendopeptidase
VSPSNFDLSVRPQDDFYAFANGGWIADPRNACPPEYSSWNTFVSLRDRNLERLRDILVELQQKPLEEGESAKVQLFYSAFMNEDKIEEELPSTLFSLIQLCLSNEVDPTTKVATLHSDYGVGALFKFYSMPDKNDSNWTIGTLYQGGLGMPDRDYYILPDKADKRLAYLVYVTKILELLGEWGIAKFRDKKFCASSAQAIVELETSLANAHFTRTDCRDPQATCNTMTIARATE